MIMRTGTCASAAVRRQQALPHSILRLGSGSLVRCRINWSGRHHQCAAVHNVGTRHTHLHLPNPTWHPTSCLKSCTRQLHEQDDLSSKALARRHSRRTKLHAIQGSEPETGKTVSSIIASVLNDKRQSMDQGSEAQMLLDALDLGVDTGVVRSWDTTLTHMEVAGSWRQHPNARRMAMLAVFQERFYERAKLLYRAMQHVEQRHPGYIAPQDLQRVYDLEKRNMLNPAVECLGPHQLTQLCVALLPLERVEVLVEEVLGQVQDKLMSQGPYNRGDEGRRQGLLQSLDRIRASMLAKVYLARLRLRMADAQRRLSQPEEDQGSEAPRAAAPGATTQAPAPRTISLAWNRGYSPVAPRSPPRSMWQREEEPEAVEEEERLHFYLLKELGGPGQGKVGGVAFRTVPQALDAPRSASVGCSSFSAADAREEFVKLGTTLQMCRLLQGVDAPPGVMSDTGRLHRSLMLDAIIEWAMASPAIRPERLPAECRHRITMRNRDDAPGAFSRGITLSASGRALGLLRDACLDRGVAFLAGFSPNVGNPFAEVTEWNYFREAAQVWTRFVEMPPVDSVLLKLDQVLPLDGSDIPLGPSGQQREVTLKLAKPEFVGFVAMLTEYVAGNLPFDRQSWFPVDGPMRIRKHAGGAAAVAAAGVAAGGRHQAEAAVLDVMYMPQGSEPLSFSLTGQHIQALVAVVDDLLTAVPGFLRLPPTPLVVAPQGRGSLLLQRGLSMAGTAARVAATALLLALPLLAILRPQGLVSPRPASASGLATIATPTLRVTTHYDDEADASTEPAAAAGGTAQGPAVAAWVQPLNRQLPEADLRDLCGKVAAQVQGRVWIPVPDQRAEDMVMVYQVVVDRTGSVLGCSPANLEAVITYQELTLSGILRGPDFAQRQAKYLEALSPEALKRGNKGDASKLAPAYRPVPWTPLPSEGAVVLKLEMRPDPEDRTFYTAGKVRVDVAAAEVKVVPWSDEDSVAMWRASGTVLQDAPRQGTTPGGAMDPSAFGSIHLQGDDEFKASGDLGQLLKAAQQWAEKQEQQEGPGGEGR